MKSIHCAAGSLVVCALTAISLTACETPFETEDLSATTDEFFFTDLIAAGGGDASSAVDVGEVFVWNDDATLYVEYQVSEPDWCITRSHLHVGLSSAEIPQAQGNPIPGQFDQQSEHDCVTEHVYQIQLEWPGDTQLFIAAHAEVERLPRPEVDLRGFAETLPDTAEMWLDYGGSDSYYDVTISEAGGLDGTHDGWCVDPSNAITLRRNYFARFYSSYEPLPEGLLRLPENVDLVNYVINQKWVGEPSPSGGIYSWIDVQAAIWSLIDYGFDAFDEPGSDQERRTAEILAGALLHGGFVPACGDLVGVILDPVTGPFSLERQVIMAEVEVPCDLVPYQRETAWAAGDDFPGNSWAMYFSYTVQS